MNYKVKNGTSVYEITEVDCHCARRRLYREYHSSSAALGLQHPEAIKQPFVSVGQWHCHLVGDIVIWSHKGHCLCCALRGIRWYSHSTMVDVNCTYLGVTEQILASGCLATSECCKPSAAAEELVHLEASIASSASWLAVFIWNYRASWQWRKVSSFSRWQEPPDYLIIIISLCN